MIPINVEVEGQIISGRYTLTESKKEVEVISSTGSRKIFPVYAQGEDHAAREGLKKLFGFQSEYDEKHDDNDNLGFTLN